MESNITNEDDSNKKPLNIVLLGDESSEKEKLMSKFILLNSPQFQDNEIKIEKDKEEDVSIFQNIIHTVELHGEKLRMKFWDNPSSDEFLSPSIKIAQGILLFYSIKNRNSYKKIQEDLSKIIELGRFDIPIIVIGNHKTSPERQVTYEEAKTWADNYGLRFYETSLENDGSIKEILQDIGEQLLFQECILSANNSVIINDNDKENNKDDTLNLEENLNIDSLIENKSKESAKKEKNKEMRNSVSYINKDDKLEKNSHKKEKSLNKQLSKSNLNKFNSSSNFKKIKPKLKIRTDNFSKEEKENHLIKNYSHVFNTINNTNIDNNNNNNNYTTNNKIINSSASKISNFLKYSKINIIKKAKNLFKKNNPPINPTKTNRIFHSKTLSTTSLNISSSDSNAHSYLKKTTLTKNREKEIKEKKIKIEQEYQTLSAQKEREGLELKKRKILENKEKYLKKIKEDKIIQKEQVKKKKEEEIKNAKNNYDKLKQENEITSQEKKIEKEKDKLNKIAIKQTEKEKLNKRVEEINKQREKEIENMKNKKLKEKIKEENEEKIRSSIIKTKSKKLKEKVKEEEKKETNEEKRASINKTKSKKLKEKTNLNSSYNFKSKSENLNDSSKNKKDINKSNKDKEKDNNQGNINEKEKELKDKIASVIIEKEKDNNEIIKAKEELKNNFIKNRNNEDIYRCLKCNLIPKIIFNESSQEIEIFCEHSNINNSHHNIVSYQNFQTKNLENSLYENTFCYFCNKSLNKMQPNDMIYFCPKCHLFFCSNDENIHIKQKHQNEIDIKNNYKLILENRNKKRKASVELNLNKKHNSSIINSARKLSLKNKSELKKTENKPNEIKETFKKEFTKIPIYLLDTFCIYHEQKYTAYCHNCQKNICNICKDKEHKEHLFQNFEYIFNDEELNTKKLELKIIKENLSKINEYFLALIEAIKCRFEKLLKAKQKEIEIKEKIIKDYENTKYNYNSILNIKNLNLNNKQNFISSNNNMNWIQRINIIFEYLNSPLISENNNIFSDLNNNIKYNIDNLYLNNENIKSVIKLKNNDIALINNKSQLKIFDINKFDNEKIELKLFKEENGINSITQLSTGELVCCGYEKIKQINLDLYDEKSSIETIIKEKNNNFLSLIELKKNFLISSDASKNIKLWNKNKFNLYQCLNMISDNDIEINKLFKINKESFIGYSFNDKKIIKFFALKNNDIEKQNEIDNIRLINLNNFLIILESNYLLLNYEDNLEFGIMIINLDKFEILKKITNIIPLYCINNNEKEKILTINENGFIQKWKFSKGENKLYECEKVKIISNTSINKKIFDFLEISDNIILFQYKNRITKYYKNRIFS